MICGVVQVGCTVGITANSHVVIRDLLDETGKAAEELGILVRYASPKTRERP